MSKADNLAALGSNVTTDGHLSSASTLSLKTNSTTALTIDTSQNVGIGTTSPSSYGAKFVVSDGTVNMITSPYGAGSTGYFGTYGSHALALLTNNTERMRIDSSGNVGIGTASPTSGYKLDVAGNFKVAGSIDENIYAVVDAAGVALTPRNGTIQTWTLGAARTPTSGTWDAGESMTLMINDGTAFTVTWTTLAVVWVGGTAPTLATTGFTVIELWKVSTTIYGALVGNVA
jgi:hypothetical protein